jgi:ceramide glucosyltransferase
MPLAILTVLTVIGLMIVAAQVLATRRQLRRVSPPGVLVERAAAEPVSILKPLKGLDDQLEENLESFCRLRYPCYEIVFCLEDRADPAYAVACRIRDRHPEREISVRVFGGNEGLNPKVRNLLTGYRHARYPLLLVSDSNVRAEPDYLSAVTAELRDPAVGLVSNPILGTGATGLGARLENLHLNSFVLGSVCFLDTFLDWPCVVGKSMLFRRRDLEAVGGLAGVRDVLAEDYVLGREIHRAGRRVALSSHPVRTVNARWTLGRFLNRHTRWGKLRWNLNRGGYLAELLTNPVFLAALSVPLSAASAPALALLAGAAAAKAGAWWIQCRLLGFRFRPADLWLLPLKDLLIGALWLVPLVSYTVSWRGHRFRIGRDTRLRPAPEAGVCHTLGEWARAAARSVSLL